MADRHNAYGKGEQGESDFLRGSLVHRFMNSVRRLFTRLGLARRGQDLVLSEHMFGVF